MTGTQHLATNGCTTAVQWATAGTFSLNLLNIHQQQINAPFCLIHKELFSNIFQNLYEKDTKQNNLQRCLEDRSSIEFNQIKSIADKISTNELPKLCQNLNIPENRIESWLSKNKEYSPAYRMLFYWMQKDDLVS